MDFVDKWRLLSENEVCVVEVGRLVVKVKVREKI